MKKNHNFSIAIDTNEGTVTPNIKAVQLKTILQIDTELKSLIAKSASLKLTVDDF
jgi:pyruvate/2-oxoglutarate dehydrogenase complex dihydrolipoamide acyltransferase (E2) component